MTGTATVVVVTGVGSGIGAGSVVVVVTSGCGSGFGAGFSVAHDANPNRSIAISTTRDFLPLCIDLLLLYYYSFRMINRKAAIVHRYSPKYNTKSIYIVSAGLNEKQQRCFLILYYYITEIRHEQH